MMSALLADAVAGAATARHPYFQATSVWDVLLSAAIVAAQLVLATHLFARSLPHRSRHRLRALLVLFAVSVVTLVGSLLRPSIAERGNEMLVLAEIALFFLMPFVLAAVVLCCRSTTAWVALFCGVSAHLMQNIASGLEGLLRYAAMLLVEAAGAAQPASPTEAVTVALLSTSIVYTTCYLTFLRTMDNKDLIPTEDRSVLVVFVAETLVSVLLDMIIKTVPDAVSVTYRNALRVVHLVLCAFIMYCMYQMLYNKRLQSDVESMSQMLAASARQYAFSRRSVEIINRTFHDLKAQMRRLYAGGAGGSDDGMLLGEPGDAEALEKAASRYDAVLHTGNEALDVILTEKSLLCEDEDITLSCIADGSTWDFMAATDLYALFDGALGAAIRAVRRVGDPELRTISLTSRQRAGVAIAHVEHYGALDVDLRVVRAIAERYGGITSAHVDAGVSRLDVMIPVPPC